MYIYKWGRGGGSINLQALIVGIITGDPLYISVFTIFILGIFITLIQYTSYFKNRFPKLHMFLNKGSNNK